MILQDNDNNCCLLDFKCTKTKLQQCEHFKTNGKNSKCVSEYKSYCFNLYAQRDFLLEILYPDTAETTRLINDKEQINKKKKELSVLDINNKKG